MLFSRTLPILLTSGLLLVGCGKPPAPPMAAAKPTAPQARLAPLGQVPSWETLAPWAGSMNAAECLRLLDEHYAEPLAYQPHVDVETGPAGDFLVIARQSNDAAAGTYRLPLATGSAKKAPASARYWRRREEIAPSPEALRPLLGRRIALDPGHIGGTWAKVEERFFQRDSPLPVREGNHSLAVAQLLRQRLLALGAEVFLVREKTEPVTPLRPADFQETARAELLAGGIDASLESRQTPRSHRLQWNAEKLFYRTAEIRERARLVNDVFRPDAVVCLHFNAEGGFGGFSPANHFHMLLSGGYTDDELAMDDERHEMLSRLLGRVHEAEIPLNAAVARGLVKEHGLPAFTYKKGALPVKGEPYLWCRNLLASRLYRCPVAYCEPYIMNNKVVYARLVAGNYEGNQEILGTVYKSIYLEYADGVAAGLVDYFTNLSSHEK
jgi:N-acetylmuramoyl-L-alanine amidase